MKKWLGPLSNYSRPRKQNKGYISVHVIVEILLNIHVPAQVLLSNDSAVIILWCLKGVILICILMYHRVLFGIIFDACTTVQILVDPLSFVSWLDF